MVRSPSRQGLSPERYLFVVAVAGVLLTLIIFTGAAVRLTESGLGCENWPECSDESFVPANSFHGWIEFGNRLLSGVVALGTIAAVVSAYRRSPRRTDLINWAWIIVAGVVGQVLLGAVTVRYDLHPLLVSSHFLLSMVLLWNVVVLWNKARGGVGAPKPLADASVLRHSTAMVVAASVLLVTGTVVTGSGPNSGDFRADRLNLDLVVAARIHGIVAWSFLAVLVTLALRLQRAGLPVSAATPVLAASVAQGAIGYVQYFNGVPPELVMLHVIGAVAVWLLALRLHFSLFVRPVEVGGIRPAEADTGDAAQFAVSTSDV
jgi:cytochrome c oxidase assembly protein subunit 15